MLTDTPKSSRGSSGAGRTGGNSESRLDDAQLEENMQYYHRERQKTRATDGDNGAKRAEGRIAKDMNKKTEQHSRGKPALSRTAGG